MPLSVTVIVQTPSRDDRGADSNDRRHVLAAELERVAQEVLQQLAHLRRVGVDHRQRADLDPAAGVGDGRLEIGDDLARDRGEARRRERLRRSSLICEYASRSLISVRMRAAASSMRSRYWRASPSRQRSSRRAQPLAERQDLAQRLLQVVRRDERELVQRRVRALQLAALLGEETLGEPSLGDVFDRQQDDARHVRAVRHEPRIQHA